MSEFTEQSIGHSIAGGWLGTYHYRGLSRGMPPVRFEATFRAGDAGSFSGAILDDGPGGEATVTGVQSGREIVFTKAYVAPTRTFVHPVEYTGTLAEDGRTMQGTWHLKEAHGVWEAHRLWSEDVTEEMRARTEDTEVQETRQTAGTAA